MSETEMRVRAKAQQGCDTAIYKIEHLNHQFQACSSLEDIKVIRAKCAIFVRLLKVRRLFFCCTSFPPFTAYVCAFVRGAADFGTVSD